MNGEALQMHRHGALTYITFEKLEGCGAVRHTFSTRLGGVSPQPYGSMNLSFNRGDARENVLQNYKILCAAVGIEPAHLVLSAQQHTAVVRTVTRADCGTGFSRPAFDGVDGLVTNEPGVALVTQYADCTPLLFCDPVKRVIANSHSGWRGTAQKIGAVTVEKMVCEFGCRRADILAAVGPCIGPCCYEVDLPVYDAFADFPNRNLFFTPIDRRHFHLDLRLANRQMLTESGILPEHIDVAHLCTCCNAEQLHSHRATGGMRGNLAAIIELKTE